MQTEIDHLEQQLRMLGHAIRLWDLRDVNLLVRLIRSQHEACRLLGVLGVAEPATVSWDDLPSKPVPEQASTYPVWAMDVSRRCMVGECVSDLQVEHIDDVLANIGGP